MHAFVWRLFLASGSKCEVVLSFVRAVHWEFFKLYLEAALLDDA